MKTQVLLKFLVFSENTLTIALLCLLNVIRNYFHFISFPKNGRIIALGRLVKTLKNFGFKFCVLSKNTRRMALGRLSKTVENYFFVMSCIFQK